MAFGNPVVGGEGGELIRASIKSPNYIPGTAGWIVNRDGSAEFNNISIRIDAAVGGEIVVGPDNLPQVVISTSNFAGEIEFPSNAGFELTPAIIRAASDPVDPVNPLSLRFNSATVTTNRTAFLVLSSESQDLNSPQKARIGVAGTGSFDYIEIAPGETKIWSDLVDCPGEVLIRSASTSGNYPSRVVKGTVHSGSSSTTTLSNVTDTRITNAECENTFLENGIVYEVSVQIRTDASSGSSAAGTQLYVWKLWLDSVGGTQIGPPIQKVNESVGNIGANQNFTFVFEFTGTSGTYDIELSGIDAAGSDTLRATVSGQYHMLVKKISRPTNING